MTRYALYYAPAAHAPFWGLGCSWLGRDPSGKVIATTAPSATDISPQAMSALTASARRYGFHATLKAPFRLAAGCTEAHLLTMAQAFCRMQQPVDLPALQIRRLDDFLAICPVQQTPRIDALAMHVVAYFDPLRAALTADDLQRRRLAGLSARQEVLLQRWGYPFTEEEFRFHMTLSDSLATVDSDVASMLTHAADRHFDAVLAGNAVDATNAITVDALTIFKEAAPGAPFTVVTRIPFAGTAEDSGVPDAGRNHRARDVGPAADSR